MPAKFHFKNQAKCVGITPNPSPKVSYFRQQSLDSPTQRSFGHGEQMLQTRQPYHFHQFSLGAGSLRETFNVSFLKGSLVKRDHNLLLIPKETNTIFAKLIWWWTNSYLVKQSILIDHQGNINRFTSQKSKTNEDFFKIISRFAHPVVPTSLTCRAPAKVKGANPMDRRRFCRQILSSKFAGRLL